MTALTGTLSLRGHVLRRRMLVSFLKDCSVPGLRGAALNPGTSQADLRSSWALLEDHQGIGQLLPLSAAAPFPLTRATQHICLLYHLPPCKGNVGANASAAAAPKDPHRHGSGP